MAENKKTIMEKAQEKFLEKYTDKITEILTDKHRLEKSLRKINHWVDEIESNNTEKSIEAIEDYKEYRRKLEEADEE